jgi:hypothetical protein
MSMETKYLLILVDLANTMWRHRVLGDTLGQQKMRFIGNTGDNRRIQPAPFGLSFSQTSASKPTGKGLRLSH